MVRGCAIGKAVQASAVRPRGGEPARGRRPSDRQRAGLGGGVALATFSQLTTFHQVAR